MNPREALLMIPGFARALVIEPLADGITGVSWKVELNNQQYVLRIGKDIAAELGLDRAGEREVQAVVAQAGLTPAAEFHNVERGVSLRPWVSGQAWSRADLLKAQNLERLAHLLRDLHALPPAGQMFQPGVAARRYALQLDSQEAREIADASNLLLAELRLTLVRECLCHNDLVAENLVDAGDQLVPIDWEYAGIGDRLFDLAVVMQHHGLPASARDDFVNAYFRRDVTQSESQRLELWCRFYELLLNLWHQRTKAPQLPAETGP